MTGYRRPTSPPTASPPRSGRLWCGYPSVTVAAREWDWFGEEEKKGRVGFGHDVSMEIDTDFPAE